MTKQPKIVFELDDSIVKSLYDLRTNGLKKGEYAGFKSLHEHYSMKEGSTSYIIAAPYVGKSAFVNELMMNLAQFSDWRWVVFSPETGSVRDVYAELLWTFLRKPFLLNDKINATEEEVAIAMQFIKEHFFVLDPMHLELNESMFFESIVRIQDEYDININGCCIDPVTDLKMDTTIRSDLALGTFLTNIRKFSSSYQIHSILAFHTSYMPMVKGSDRYGNDRPYLPQPTINNTAGGTMVFRKAMMGLTLWRGSEGIINPETGVEFDTNELRVRIEKSKPKSLGSLGEVRLNYDAWSSRFYEKGVDGTKVFSAPEKESVKLEV